MNAFHVPSPAFAWGVFSAFSAPFQLEARDRRFEMRRLDRHQQQRAQQQIPPKPLTPLLILWRGGAEVTTQLTLRVTRCDGNDDVLRIDMSQIRLRRIQIHRKRTAAARRACPVR